VGVSITPSTGRLDECVSEWPLGNGSHRRERRSFTPQQKVAIRCQEMAAVPRLPTLDRRHCRSSIHRRTKTPIRRRLTPAHQQLLTIAPNPLSIANLAIENDGHWLRGGLEQVDLSVERSASRRVGKAAGTACENKCANTFAGVLMKMAGVVEG